MVVTRQDILAMMLVGKIGEGGIPDPLDIFGIYRRRPTRKGVTLVKMDFYTPTNPQTEAQQAWRAIFSAGVAAWQALSEEAQDIWKEEARYRPLTGFNLFLRDYLLSQ
jgi:hypothetical protein